MLNLGLVYFALGVFVGLYLGNKKFKDSVNGFLFKSKSGGSGLTVYLGQGNWNYHIAKDCPQLQGVPTPAKLSTLDREKFKACDCVKRMYQ